SEHGQFKVRRWTNADLGATTDVRILKGSFSQMSSLHKAEVVATYTQSQLLNPVDAQHMVANQVGAIIGLQDNPYRLRVRRQISLWEEGPPEGWAPQTAPDPMTGQPVPDPVLSQVWAPEPVDDQPDVAAVRMYELGRSLSGSKAEQKPPEWRAGLQQEYEKARIAAGTVTVAEQQQQAQAAQQQQEQAMQQQQEQAAQAEAAKQDQIGQLAKGVEQALGKITQQIGQIAKSVEGLEQGQTDLTAEVKVVAQDAKRDVAVVSANLDTKLAQAVTKLQTELTALVTKLLMAKDKAPPAPTRTEGPQVAVAPLASPDIVQSLDKVVQAIKAQARPTSVSVVRDKSGKITGATENPPRAKP
ncbi:MAG: hypothetical protein ACRDHG_13200, partial [Anaerolineales bacterium]